MKTPQWVRDAAANLKTAMTEVAMTVSQTWAGMSPAQQAFAHGLAVGLGFGLVLGWLVF